MSDPEFGPRGYLPPQAAKRARKIVLREQMGWGWPLAAVGAAVLVAVAGIAFLLTSSKPPGDPYVRVGPLSAVEPNAAAPLAEGPDSDIPAMVVRAGGTVRAFLMDPGDIAWCPESGRLESRDAAWNPDGRRVAGEGPSLQPLRSVVFDGDVYVDFSADLPRPPPAPGGDPPVCRGR